VVTSAREEDVVRFDIRTWSLSFVDGSSERGFRDSREAALVRSLTLGCSCVGAFSAVIIAWTLLSGSRTCNGILVETPQAYRVCGARQQLHIVLVVLMFLSVVAIQLRALARRIGMGGREVLAMAIMMVGSAGIILQHPMYIATLLRVQDRSLLFVGNAGKSDWELLLYVDAVVMGINLTVPLRWSRLWAVNLAVLAMATASILALGDGSSGPASTLLGVFALLCAVAAVGKREREVFERMHYAYIAMERTLRAEAEFKLSQGDSSSSPAAANKAADARSAVTSALTRDTGEVFCLTTAMGAGKVEDRLGRIIQLGKQEHWLIEPEEVQLFPKQIIGIGGFGLVIKGTLHGAPVAIKVPRVSYSQAPEKLGSIVEELRIYRRLKHPNIVPFLGASILSDTLDIFMVLSYVHGQTLRVICPTFPAESAADVARRSCWVDDICCALAFLHAQAPAIVHGDIKASNVIVASDGDRPKAMLLDFGLSRLITPNARRLGGTLQWTAPEVVLKTHDSASPAADVFSFGRLLYMIMTGLSPLFETTREEIIQAAFERRQMQLQWPDSMPQREKIAALVGMCTHMKPQRRPPITEAQRRWRELHPLVWPQQDEEEAAKDLRAALEEVRSVGPDAIKQMVKSENASASQGAASDGRLVHSTFKCTPDPSCVVSLVRAIQKWNVPVTTADCCTLHAVVRKAAELSSILKESRCNNHIPGVDSQCPNCLLVTEGHPDVCAICRCEVAPASGRTAESPTQKGGAHRMLL